MTTQLSGVTQSHLSTNQNEGHETGLNQDGIKYTKSQITKLQHVYSKTLTRMQTKYLK